MPEAKKYVDFDTFLFVFQWFEKNSPDSIQEQPGGDGKGIRLATKSGTCWFLCDRRKIYGREAKR